MSTDLARVPGGMAMGSSTAEAFPVVEMDSQKAAAMVRAESEVRAQVFLAKQYPRNELIVFQRVLAAMDRVEMAEDATYSFPRGTSTIMGPSVYLAREAARIWGNIRHGLRRISTTDDLIHIQGWAYDVETNAYAEAEDQFKPLIQRKQKDGTTKWVEPDERDLRELVNRRGAFLIRNCILELLPSDLINSAIARSFQTKEAKASGKLKENREDALRNLVLGFDRQGITVAMLEEYLRHPLNAITASEFAELQGIGKAIKDGQAVREDYFDLQAGAVAPLQERIRADQAESGRAETARARHTRGRRQAPAEVVDTATGEVKQVAQAELEKVAVTAPTQPAVEVQQATPAPTQEKSEKSDLDDAIDQVEAMVGDLVPQGGDAAAEVREQIKKMAYTLLDDTDPLLQLLLQVADDPALGRGQANRLQLRLSFAVTVLNQSGGQESLV